MNWCETYCVIRWVNTIFSLAKRSTSCLAVSPCFIGCIMYSQSKAITYCINILIHLDVFVQDKLELTCVHDSSIAELMRGIRSQFSNLVPGLPERELTAMTLGLAHRLVTFPDGAFFLTNNTCICFMCLVESIRLTNMNRLNKKNL